MASPAPVVTHPASASEYRLVARALAIAVTVAVPLRTIGLGDFPPDDALRHAAKAVSGRPWSEILVLRPGMEIDNSPGWHALLQVVHLATGATPHSLVLFSVIGLFLLLSAAPLALLRRPEAWLFTLATVGVVDPPVIGRLLIGRPFLLTGAIVVALCLTWQRLRGDTPDRAYLACVVLGVTASVWIHGTWYLWALVLAAFVLAREWRASVRLGLCIAAGVTFGALLTGHPIAFLAHAIRIVQVALSGVTWGAALVNEFHPFDGAVMTVLAVGLFLAWRALRGGWHERVIADPVFALMAVGWTLGWVNRRFYLDWAMPAAMAWIALEIQDAMERARPQPGRARLALAAMASVLCLLTLTSDVAGRWSHSPRTIFLSAENPAHAPCLPDAGGTFYAADMALFYSTFFRNPLGPWRYQVGFEPGLMPAEDVAIYANILNGGRADLAYDPWVRRMGPADRLVIRSQGPIGSAIPELTWEQPVPGLWCGRLPAGGKAAN